MLGDFGDYELLQEIGRGGQGIVYRAQQKSLNRTVALKVIGLGHWATETHLKRFRREAEAAASLEHPGIVPIYEVGERDGSCYFSMKFVEGGQLDEVTKREPMPGRRAAELIAKVARTVHYAHEHGILHRDIKPGNILLDGKGEPHLTDFGLARLVETESTVTRTLEVLGTPSYMAPEQAVGNNAALTAATDVYGLGAVLYELLTGQPPFAGGTTYETIKLLLDTEPRQPRVLNAKIGRDLSIICLKCLEKDPQRRYSSALALAEDLERWLKHEPILARRTGILTRGRKWVRRNPSIAAMTAMLLALAVPLGVMIWKSETRQLPTSNLVEPEKSIAVLPFSNLSKEPENAFFADGMQDEILTDLARIADLKVISRTSVMHYKSGTARNLREIGRQLGVANVVEGSVQRTGNRVRVNAQLIDARTDRHLWGQTYDRDVADVFAIQSEIARSIADQLQAKLSPAEENAIARPPTSDLTAFDLYIRAKNLGLSVNLSATGSADMLRQVDLLNQAVARDPSFLAAYCELAIVHDYLYFSGYDHTSARLALADAAIRAAFRLRPEAGETHLARAHNLYQGYLDFDGALAELEVARQTLPNEPRVLRFMGFIKRRQGHWEESTRNLERAIEVDPRNVMTLQQTALSYLYCRRYADEKSLLDRVLTVVPNDVAFKAVRAIVEFDSRADTRPLHEVIDSVATTQPGALSSAASHWLMCALAERDIAAAKTALIALGEHPLSLGVEDNVVFNRAFAQGIIARLANQGDKARSAFTSARAEQEKIVQREPNYGPAMCVLGLIDAALGRKEEALREGRRAVELVPVEKDPFDANIMTKYFAMIAAWVGDKDLACEQLASAVRRPPSDLSYGKLKLLPYWDPLRGDPRFEKIVEDAKQPVAIEATTNSAPEESIAVLPFENLSDDKEHAFFADGVQDDILTKLAKIADLKVISRTSVMQYRGKQNTREIGNALRVSHVLEGSVRRDRARIHLNAQLIDTRTDAHVWAEEYDRNLSQMFAIQSEIAQKVAQQLHAKMSASEKLAIESRPTADLAAFDLYTRAKNILLEESKKTKAELLEAIDLLNQAVAVDPSFSDAYCQLAFVHDWIYFSRADHTSARLALAEAAIQAAARLNPNAGETHLARAQNLYWGYLDYDGALAELEVARQILPNNFRVTYLMAAIQRRRGHWEESTRGFEHAAELNPRNMGTRLGIVTNYTFLRRYADAKSALASALAAFPTDLDTRIWPACAEFQAKADTRPLHQMLDLIRATNPAGMRDISEWPIACALAQRDATAAKNALDAHRDKGLMREPAWVKNSINLGGEVFFSPSFVEGLIARMTKDEGKARSAFVAARAEQEKVVRAQPDDFQALGLLGLIDAGLGRKEEALREGRRAVELLPVEKDPLEGVVRVANLAMIAAWVGDKDLAFEQLESIIRLPSPLSYGGLKLFPWWDSLRGDPRFEKVLEEAKHPVALK
jgi:TolB-like protein/Tfp pilus assembly protein PilF